MFRFTSYLPRAPTLLAALVLLAGVVVVEIGVRDLAPPGVPLPVPEALEGPLGRLRATVVAGIDDPRAGSVASGVVFGRTEHVMAADEQAFLESGLWHLLAASGQNVALVAACSVLLARACGGSRLHGACIGIAAVPMYVLVVGGGASIVRAGIMGELALLAWLVGRIGDVWQFLLVAASLICWFAPGAHRSLGMQLSFACVIALITWASPLTAAIRARGVPAWLAGGVAVTLLCSVSTAPILALRTGAAPLTGIVANLLAVPLAGCILVVGLAASLLVAAGDVVGVTQPGALAMRAVGLLASVLLDIAHRAAGLPAAQTTSRVLSVGVPLAALVWWLGRRRARARRVAAVIGVLCVVVAAAGTAAPSVGLHIGGPGPLEPGRLRIAVLDVGQGDATLLQADGRSVLVDAGPPDGDVVRRVRALGVRRVDGIVLTHDSLDHRGGFAAAHAALRPAWVARPRHAPGPWRQVEATAGRLIDLCDGGRFDLGSASVVVRNPPCEGRVRQRTTDVHNDGAMVLLVRHGDVHALLPADAEAPVLTRLGLPPLAFLRVAHHGSSDPDLPRLLADTRPSMAAISVGEGNHYGHPTPQALAALHAGGVRTFRTDRDGTVVVESDRRVLRQLG
ncbi:MAG: fold metallo-hydrolase [Thermoleophilia bacterium]|nr:fold metallo-hydrolase [Thermoleophilia bacterium]